MILYADTPAELVPSNRDEIEKRAIHGATFSLTDKQIHIAYNMAHLPLKSEQNVQVLSPSSESTLPRL